ncbi:sensor histidine kinase [Pseudonocardia parietis]|uniref:histidine kinase n=1 Tax=Pseudonocardia parietis TaxID=570936 RepID=A0ABS4VR27_9PSEU|nr:HAMP domain-containing sensor histidine kinase [Pseudonocardia parietis]MBP2366377.1 two-component system OmpR family sensor kinase [Pseudonocardia parietis]
MAAGSFSGVLGRHRRARFVAGHLADVLVVVTLCVLVVAVTRPAVVAGRIDVTAATSILTLVAAAVGSAAAIVALVTGRLTGDPRPSWFGAALLLYGVIVLPLSALVIQARPGGVARLAVLAMLAVGMCILIAALRPPPRLGAWGGWALFAVALAVGAAVASQGENAVTVVLAQSPLSSVLVQAGWAIVALLFLLDGYRRQSRVRSRVGLGLLTIAVSQLYRAVVPGEPVAGLVYPSLRILGMAVVLSALLTIALRAVSDLQDDYDRLMETVGDATRLLERAAGQAAERDHELRNGLAGLAGAAYLLSHDSGDERTGQLRDSVLTELGRLREMLENPVLAPCPDSAADDTPDPLVDERDAELLDLGPEFAPSGPVPRAGNGHAHRVEAVLRQLVSLRDGQPITLDVEDGLPVVAAPETVTRQVVTNLLANCERHAPGAPVEVRGRTADAPGYVVVEIRDSGPGLPGGQETLAITRGVHDEAAGGSGLGLHISAQLVQEHGGELVLRTAHDPRGCVAVLTLPAVT